MIENFALIIGAMKAGTTTLFDHFSSHPHVAGARPKEPGFFAFEEKYARGRAWYEDLFDFDPSIHRIALEASTDYSKFPHCAGVPERIGAFGGNFRLIYSLRHPLRRIESHARHAQHKGREIGQIENARDYSLDAGISPVSLDICRYAFQLDQFQTYFDEKRLLITSMERLSKNPVGVAREICRFLGLDPDLLPPSVAKRNAGDRKWRAKEIHPFWRTASSFGPARRLARALTPQSLRDRLRLSTRQVVKVGGRFALNPDEEEKTLALLAADLKRLRDYYGFDCEAEWGIRIDDDRPINRVPPQ